MIEIITSEYGIKAAGHACYAPKGQDIVCAAFTILMYTMAEMISELNRSGKLKECHIELDSGNVDISCIPKDEYIAETRHIMSTINTGISILSAEYSEFIKKY